MKYSFSLIILILSISLQSKQDAVVAGGVASGIDGTASYSIGQSVYVSETNVSGAINEGVQQLYKVLELLNDYDVEI